MAFKPEEHRIQAYLLANAEELIRITGREDSKDWLTKHGLTQGAAGPQPMYVKKVAKDPTANGDNFSDLFNSFSSSGSIDFVTDLPGAVRKKLKPAVRIFKTIRQPGTGKELDLELKSTLADSPGSGVSLQDVEIVRLGGNPEEVDTNIKVSITLYSTKLGHFFDKQEPTPLPNWKVDSGNVVPGMLAKAAESGVSWIDLLKIDLDGEKNSDIERHLQAIGKKSKSSIVEEFGSILSMNEIDQRIKIELTYRDIEKVEGYSSEEVKTINSWISSQKEVLYLSLLEHEIGFNEDGTSTMRINYIGSGGTNTFSRLDDILFDPYLYELELQWNDEICKLNAALGDDRERDRSIIGIRANPFGTEKGDESIRGSGTKSVEGKKKAIRQREKWIDIIRTSQSQLMLSGLYGFSKYLSSGPGGLKSGEYRQQLENIKSLGAKGKSRVYVNHVLMSDITENISSRLSRRLDGSEILGVANYTDYMIALIYDSSKVDTRYDLVRQGKRVKEEIEYQANLEVEDTHKSHYTGGKLSGDSDDAAIIQFVFLGDIIETAIEVLASNRRFNTDESFESNYFKMSPDVQIPHSTVKYGGIKDLLQAFVQPFYAYRESPSHTNMNLLQPPNTEDIDKILNRVYEEYGEILFSDITYQNPANPNEEVTINLADVPISLFDYKRWYIENFVAKRRSTLYLKHFIEMLIANYVPNLFAKAKRKRGETTDKEKPTLLINRETLPVERYDFLQAANVETTVPLNALSRDRIRNEFQQNKLQSLSNNSIKSGQLTIISQAPVVNVKPSANQTRRQLNKLKNIPNIIFNDGDFGIFETLSFQKEDMPGLREARLFEGKNFVGPNIIREKYNCSLRLKGTTFFKPGSLFYLDPSPLDLGFAVDGKSPARLLGLGGYYDVLRLTHNISLAGAEEWVTNLDTKWTSFGEDDGIRKNKNSDKCETSLIRQLAHSVDLSDPKVGEELFSQRNVNRALRKKKP